MKGWESTSETTEALKLPALAIYFLIFFPLIISKPLKLPLPLESFIRPDELPPSFPYLLMPSWSGCFFFIYLTNCSEML